MVDQSKAEAELLDELNPSCVAIFSALRSAEGATVSKADLMDAAWPGVNVTENSLYQCIRTIRKALKDVPGARLQTVPRRGYRLELQNAGAGGARRAWSYRAAAGVAALILIILLAGVLPFTKSPSSRSGPVSPSGTAAAKPH